MRRPPNLSTRIFKIYREAVTEFSHVYSPDGLNNTLLSQRKVAPGAGAVVRMYVPRTEEGERSLWVTQTVTSS